METLRDKVIRESEQACQHAIASTPDKYRGFVLLISQNKNIGNRQKPDYVPVRTPYMTVDGRLAMARDEHRGLEGTLDIYTEFIPIGDSLLCKATAISSIHGTTIGHAKVGIGGSGVDATNPWENSESSAWGRALAAMGYGLFGTGIASAEEVLASMSEQETKRVEEKAKLVEPGSSEPTQKHLGVLFGHLKRLGVRDGHKRQLVEFVQSGGVTAAKVTAAIRDMEYAEKLPRQWFNAYVSMILVDHPKYDKKALAVFCADHFGKTTSDSWTQEQRNQLLDWLLMVEIAEPEDADVYMPGKPEDEVEANPWLVEVTRIQNETGEDLEQIEKWLLAEVGRGNYKKVEDIPVEGIRVVQRLDAEAMRKSMDSVPML